MGSDKCVIKYDEQSQRSDEPDSETSSFKVFSRSPDGKELQILVVDREKALSGELRVEEAIAMFESAERAAQDLARAQKRQQSASEGMRNEGMLYAQACALDRVANTYGGLITDIAQIKTTGGWDERHTVKEFLTPCVQLGILDIGTLIKMTEVGYSLQEKEELARIASVERSHRLNRLGFQVGLGEAVTAFYDRVADRFIDFPFPDFSVPEEQRWEDLNKRIGESGFVLDKQGRVSGFKVSDNEIVEIPERDRSPQTYPNFSNTL